MASNSAVDTGSQTQEATYQQMGRSIKNSSIKKNLKLEALTPKDDLHREKNGTFHVYKDILDDAFKNPEICNLALSGGIGSGKSSIIRSYDRRRNKGKKHFLYVSLIEFSNPDDASAKESPVKKPPKEDAPEEKTSEVENFKRKPTAQDSQKQLEYSLLSQILSCCTSEELPEGSLSGIPERFRRLRRSAFWLSSLCLAVYMLAFHGVFGKIANILYNLQICNFKFSDYFVEEFSEYIHLVLYGFVGIILFFCAYRVLRRYLPSFRVSKLTLKANNAEAEVLLGKDRTSLDIHKFELAYILERIGKKYDYTVVLEDLERLDPDVALDIMEKLRELNILTNNHIQAVKPRRIWKCIRRYIYKCHRVSAYLDRIIGPHRIRFVYAISDSTISPVQRTKFYDCIIPVVPVSNPLNGREQFAKLMEELDIPQESRNTLSNALSDAFLDYRTRLTLKNEFLVLWKLCKPPKILVKDQESEQTLAENVAGTPCCDKIGGMFKTFGAKIAKVSKIFFPKFTYPASVECNKSTMFAIAAYKVLMPKAFEEALSPEGYGILPAFASAEDKILCREYSNAEQRNKIFEAIAALHNEENLLLDSSCLRLVIGDHQLFGHWLRILLGSLDKEITFREDLDRAKTVISAIQQTNRDPKLLWHLHTASYHGSFRERMHKRLHDLCYGGAKDQFICIAESLAAVSNPKNSQDWEWLDFNAEDKSVSKVYFRRCIEFLSKNDLSLDAEINDKLANYLHQYYTSYYSYKSELSDEDSYWDDDMHNFLSSIMTEFDNEPTSQLKKIKLGTKTMLELRDMRKRS